jgi:hypothetical protein
MVRRLSPSRISRPSFRRPSMSPTPAPRVVAGGVASSFRNRSAIERCRYRSDSLWPRWNLFLWIGCDIPSYARPRARALQSVKALPPVGGARSATQKKEQDGGLHLHFRLQGLPLEAFIGRLKVTGVQAVLDVRANPLSRKPGFSKTAFSTALHGVGIIYAHFPAMGCPKPVRDRYKRDGDANLCHSMCRSFSSDSSNGVMIRL